MGVCRWCGEEHGPRCPFVKAYELYDNGELKRVEFITPMDIPPNQNPEEPESDYPKLKSKE